MTAPTPSTLPTYDPLEPARLQENDWDCSVESIEWTLYAWGRTPDDDWLEQSMIASGVANPQVGCTDASGAGLAQWVNTEYGEFGYVASNQDPVSFDDVAQETASQKHPLAMGGRGWYHWSGVRGYDPATDLLQLANPAPGWYGVGQTMSRTQFDQLGPFSLVRVTNPQAEDVSPTPPTPPVRLVGPDVSSHQKLVDWAAVKQAGASFAFAKASGGAWYTNPYFEAAWSGTKAVGLPRGAYHYAFESTGQPFPGPGPEVEARFFCDTVLPLGLTRGDMLVLDIEEGPGPLGAWALRWAQAVESIVGFPPLIYTTASFANSHGFGDVPDLANYGLWLAAWQSDPPTAIPAPWSAYPFWQFTDSAQIPGVPGYVDANVFTSTPDELPRWGMPDTTTPPIPPQDPYLPWQGLVGSGVLDMMRADNTLPAQRLSTWLPLGISPADIESCYGQNGVLYTWTVSTTNQGFRYQPG